MVDVLLVVMVIVGAPVALFAALSLETTQIESWLRRAP
jgi:hypothetical protein